MRPLSDREREMDKLIADIHWEGFRYGLTVGITAGVLGGAIMNLLLLMRSY